MPFAADRPGATSRQNASPIRTALFAPRRCGSHRRPVSRAIGKTALEHALLDDSRKVIWFGTGFGDSGATKPPCRFMRGSRTTISGRPDLGETQMTTGTAMAMRIDLSALIKRHGMTPPRFKPLPLKPATDRECSVRAWRRLQSRSGVHEIRNSLLDAIQKRHSAAVSSSTRSCGWQASRHRGPLRRFVRARTGHRHGSEALPYFSIAATIHKYELRQIDDPNAAHALITSATLDEVSLVPDNPGSPDAIVEPTPAMVEFYNLAIRGIEIIQQQLAVIEQLARSSPPTSPAAPSPRVQGSNNTLKPKRGTSLPPAAVTTPRRPTQFQALAAALNERTA